MNTHEANKIARRAKTSIYIERVFEQIKSNAAQGSFSTILKFSLFSRQISARSLLFPKHKK